MRHPGVAKACIKQCLTYADKILDDIFADSKINFDDKIDQERVGRPVGGKTILKGMGFQANPDGSNSFIMENIDMDLLKKAKAMFEDYLPF